MATLLRAELGWRESATSVGLEGGQLTMHEAFSVPSTTQVVMNCAGQNSTAQNSWMSAIKVASLSVA